MIRPNERPSLQPGISSTGLARALPAPLTSFFSALCLLTAVSTGFELFQHFVLRHGYPYDWPLVAPVSRFDDLLDWLTRFRSLHTEAFFHASPPVVYPAPMSMLYGLLGLLGRAALPAYLSLAALTAATGLLLFHRTLRQAAIRRQTALLCTAILLGTSYPFWFLVYTANLELIVCLLCAAGILFFCRDFPRTAATFFGLAASLKLTPLLFLLLFTRRKRWPALLQGLATGALVTIASLWGVFPNVARSWHETQLGTALFIQRDALHNLSGQLGFDHSLLALIKFFLPGLTPAALTHLWRWSAPFTALAILGLWFGRVRRFALPKEILFLSAAMVFLAPVSYDYTLIELYVPWGLLVAAMLRRTDTGWRPWAIFACFALIFTAQGWMILAGDHRGAQIKAAALLCLLVILCTSPDRDVSEERSHFLQPTALPSVL